MGIQMLIVTEANAIKTVPVQLRQLCNRDVAVTRVVDKHSKLEPQDQYNGMVEALLAIVA